MHSVSSNAYVMCGWRYNLILHRQRSRLGFCFISSLLRTPPPLILSSPTTGLAVDMDAPVGSELTPVGQLPDRVVGDGWTLLYCLGSYAPAHRNHMELLVLARQFCEQRGLRVLGIMVAPTADSSLREKLGFLPLPLEARYHCLRLLFASTPGLAGIPVLVDRYLAEGRVKGAGAAAQHIEELIKEKYGGQVFVRPVFGLDALTRIRSRHAVANAIVVLNRSSSEVGPDPDAFVARHPHGAAIKYIASPNWREGAGDRRTRQTRTLTRMHARTH